MQSFQYFKFPALNQFAGFIRCVSRAVYRKVSLEAVSVAPMQERRNTPRQRTFKGGSIIFGLAAGIDCVIRNLSSAGAALEVENPVGIPDDFTLLIRPETIKRNCHVEWRSGNRIGVHFV